MKKISGKILVSFFVVLIVVALVPRLVFSMILPNFEPSEFSEIIGSEVFFIGIIMTTALTLVLFTLLVNRIIVRRIRLLKNATQQVSTGHYDRHIPIDGRDEISSLMQDFNAMSTALAKNEYLSRDFIRNFSHEMKTPLSSIRGYAELIEAGGLSPEEIIQYARVISQESKRLGELSHNMLQLSLVESTTLFARDEELDPSEMVRQVLQVTQMEWEEKHLDIELDLTSHSIRSNRSFIRQIIENLLTNAVRYTPPQGRIHIQSDTSAQGWRLIVTNDGPGIVPLDQERVFQLFFVAEHTRTSKSSGLGLAITKKMVDKLNGTIALDSVPHDHTTFSVIIPLEHIASDANG